MNMQANPQGASVDGAAKRLSELLQSEQKPTDSKPEEQEAQEKTGAEKPTPETQEDKSDKKVEVELYKVKVDGEEREVPLEDLRKGYMMESDYRKKTSDVSARSKALEAKAAEIDTQLSEAQTLLELDLDALESPEMLELKEDDPESYLKEFDKVQKRVASFNKLKEKRLKEQQTKQTEQAKKELEALEQAIPEWLDADVRNVQAAEVFTALEGAGYSKEELQGLSDHRMFVLARKAMLFDQMMSKDLKGKEVVTAPKSQQPGNPSDKDDKQTVDVKKMRQQLKKSGSMKDAARLMTM